MRTELETVQYGFPVGFRRQDHEGHPWAKLAQALQGLVAIAVREPQIEQYAVVAPRLAKQAAAFGVGARIVDLGTRRNRLECIAQRVADDRVIVDEQKMTDRTGQTLDCMDHVVLRYGVYAVVPSKVRRMNDGWRFCIAPMMDFTDRFCRFFHRRLSARARLYTEMVTTGALIHGPRDRLLAFDESEHPVALQLGGSEPHDLARCAAMGEAVGYDEINLNCGCPSERVQRGAFGACLMAEPSLVADCVKAMVDRVSIPVTVKHRIGLDQIEDYGFVRDFVGTVAAAGCKVFIVHARNAWLKGLSPRENREIPPLRYAVVRQIKRDFPDLTVVLNGGLRDHATALAELASLDGVMLGRAACDSPWLLSTVDSLYYRETDPLSDRIEAAESMIDFAVRAVEEGVPARAVLRHLLGLFNGLSGARQWRRTLSDAQLLDRHGAALLGLALAPMRAGLEQGLVPTRSDQLQSADV